MDFGRVHYFLRSILAPQRGIALLMVLWVLTILMVVVFSFSYLVRTETFSSRAFKEGWENKFLAEAGIERALMELFYRKQNPQNLEAEDQEVWRIDGTEQGDALGGGYYRVRLLDESGKIDLNLAPEVILRNLLYSLDLPGDDKDLLVNTIVDSILDWKDPDDFIRLHGAESDYYQSLPHPYKAKNGIFDTVEELILVKGITPEILYGSGQKPGLVDFLTVQAKTNKINLNAAPKEVLTALPGMTPEIAEAVVAYRQDKEIKSLQEIAGLLGEAQAQLAPYVTVSAGNTFTIESRGYKKNNQAGYGIQAKVMLEGTNGYHYLSYKNPVIIKTEKGASE
jgi:general secretion pathway protein K